MVERLKQIPTRLLEVWNKFTKKQKAIIISVVAIVVIFLAIMMWVLGRTTYEVLTVCDTTEDASAVAEVLDEQGYSYKLGADKLTIEVDQSVYSEAVLAIASSDLPSSGISVEELLDNDLSTTNSDRTLKLNLFIQDQLRNYLVKMEGVKDAQVTYIPVDSSNSILSQATETSASVMLTITDDFNTDTAQTIAELVASVIGNDTTDKIKVADQYGNLLFGGADDLYSGSASSNQDYADRLRNTLINNIYMGLLKLGYDDVEVVPNLVLNMDKVTELYTEYTPADGQEQGLYSSSYTYESEGASGSSGGVAGTSSNDETDYLTDDGTSDSSSVSIEKNEYLPNKRETNTEYEIGTVETDQSSISIVLTDTITYNEDDLESQGLLDGTTFEEYAIANGDRVKVDVDPDILDFVSKATGISEDNISILVYQQPMFVPTTESSKSFADYLPYILAALIIGLLVFIVFRTAQPVEVVETEPELSVEELLATTKENQPMEDIEFDDKSETRKMIEKFVDENPEAVANLLRNWLGDDWN